MLQVQLSLLYRLVIPAQIHIAADFIAEKRGQEVFIADLPFLKQRDGLQGHIQGFIVLVQHIVLLSQLQRMLHIPRVCRVLLQKEADVPHGMGPGLLLGRVYIAKMVHENIELLRPAADPVEALMDTIDEPGVGMQLRHPAHQQVRVHAAVLLQIVPLGIHGHPVLFIFTGAKEVNHLRDIIEPLVVVQKEEPFPPRLLQPRVAGLGEILAPLELYDLIRIFLDDAPHLLPASRVHQDKLRWDILQQRLHGVQAFPHSVRTVGNQD